jgi:predicted mannosyl-3-phosphoglycerate phosphatase (HAD superfamily)
MAEQNKLDGAFIQFDDDVPTKELCARLRERNVPVIFTASDTARAAGYLLRLVPPLNS